MHRPSDGRDTLRNALRLLAGLAVSLACLYFATRGTDWAQVGQVLRRARAAWIIAIVVVSVGTVYIRAQRWRVLLRPVGDVPLYPALSATAIGFGASAVLPFRVGELLRPALLGRRVGVALSAALSSVVLERLFDMLLVISCFLVVSLMWPVPDTLRRGAWVLAGVAALGFAALMVVQRRRATSEALLEHVLRYLPGGAARGFRSLARSFLDGLGGLSDGRAVVLVLGYSAYLWAVITLTFMFGFLALEIDVPLFAASLATVVIVAAFVFLPQAPGFIGTWQAGCVLSLGLFGVSQETALGYSLLTWIIQMSTNIATAGFFLAREGMSVGQLMRVAPPE